MQRNINSKLTNYVEDEQLLRSYDQDMDDDVTHLFLDKSRDNDYITSTEERKYSSSNSISTSKRQANSGWNSNFEVTITFG